jgi:hypothetical protein
MPKKNRLNPRSENRQDLRQLEQSGILCREKIGLRNIIRADTGEIEYCGHNITGEQNFIKQEPRLGHFGSGGECVSRSIHFKGRAARILAMTDKRGSQPAEPRLGATLPVNELASELLKEPCRTLEFFFPDRPMYGDAVLITDNRMHWVFSIYGLPEDDLRDFAVMLATPWEIRSSNWCPELIFLEEPSLADITTMKFRWGSPCTSKHRSARQEPKKVST